MRAGDLHRPEQNTASGALVDGSGSPHTRQYRRAPTRGRQIAGRFVVIPAAPFSHATAADQETWRALIGTLESLLRLHEHAPGTLSAMSDYLFHRTAA
ncbi:hypothetical protein [Streptomyces sp. NPDC017529]|uniref:hypothetical protein n=1 Tax=Streptomyces sp. NPDC017529 TaxID=3365000 RepID=UPI0037A9AD3B